MVWLMSVDCQGCQPKTRLLVVIVLRPVTLHHTLPKPNDGPWFHLCGAALTKFPIQGKYSTFVSKADIASNAI